MASRINRVSHFSLFMVRSFTAFSDLFMMEMGHSSMLWEEVNTRNNYIYPCPWKLQITYVNDVIIGFRTFRNLSPIVVLGFNWDGYLELQ